jgi:hypothetical protein
MSAPTIGADRFHDDFLDTLRQEGDPPADAVVAAFIESDVDVHAGGIMSTLIAHSVGTHVTSSGQTSRSLQAFAEERPPLPPWADSHMVARGQDLFAQFVPLLGVGLWMASVPAGYAGAHGAQVLARTARLVSDPKRRFMETGQFILDVMTPGGLEPGGAGSRDIRHVRLIHAATRRLLTDPDDDSALSSFDVATFGAPINQEDLLGTLFTFSIIGLQVLDRGGVRVSDDDAEAYVHMWNVIGHLMGVRPDLLPLDRRDSEVVFERIQRRNYATSDAGRELTAAAIEAMQDLLALRILRGVPAAGIREYLGRDLSDLLGVPRAGLTKLLFVPPRWFNQWSYRLEKDSRLARALHERVGRRLFRGFVAYERGGRPPFQLSEGLQVQLGLVRKSRMRLWERRMVARLRRAQTRVKTSVRNRARNRARKRARRRR